MAIRNLAQRQSLADKFAADNPYGAVFTADPGATGTPSNEVTGGSPAYARCTITWGAADGTATVTGTGTVNLPAGITPTHQSPCTTSGTGSRVSDAQPITPAPGATGAQTTATLTFKYQQL